MPNDFLGPVVLDIAGIELQQDEKEILGHPKVGGLILFSRNYEHSEQLLGLVRTIREANPRLIVCVDHEGGRVQRFREGFTRLPAVQKLSDVYAESPERALLYAKELGWLMAAELLAHDIDLSFAPVLDLDEHLSDVIGDRSFSKNPEIACKLAGAFMDGMHDAGMATTGKHFPGHGGIKADSHLELPVDERELDALEAHDLIPFSTLLKQLDAVMSAHIMYPSIDKSLVSFSPFWLKTYLREKLGYRGIVFSDDLSMEGAAGAGSFENRAHEALNAGCDSVLVCNNPSGAVAVIESLERNSNFSSDVKLESLSKQKTWTLAQLHGAERWSRAVEIAEKLI